MTIIMFSHYCWKSQQIGDAIIRKHPNCYSFPSHKYLNRGRSMVQRKAFLLVIFPRNFTKYNRRREIK